MMFVAWGLVIKSCWDDFLQGVFLSQKSFLLTLAIFTRATWGVATPKAPGIGITHLSEVSLQRIEPDCTCDVKLPDVCSLVVTAHCPGMVQKGQIRQTSKSLLTIVIALILAATLVMVMFASAASFLERACIQSRIPQSFSSPQKSCAWYVVGIPYSAFAHYRR